jgi:hypothetical protein
MEVKNDKNTWAPMIGIWRLDKVSGTQSRASVSLFYLPGKRYKKPYVLDSAAGIKLLNAFCAVTTEQDLVKFLNSNGSIELKEPNSDDPNHLENWLKPLHRRVRAETPIFPRKEMQQSDIDRLLKFAASLKWLREFAEIIKSCDSQPEKLLKYASLTEFPRNKLMKSFTANQILQFAPHELYNSRERINRPTYEVPVDWCCFKLPDLIRKRAKFVNECARHFVQQILSNLLSELAPIVTSTFKISYEPRTPSTEIPN